MFYVYEIFIVKTGEIIYVGKGTRNRYRAKKKNKFLNHIMETQKCDTRIIAHYETEEEAFETERKRIVYLKSINQAICNKAVYSTGGVGYIWTEERRKMMSEMNPMKREEQKKRMSELNPMKNKDVAARVGATHRKPIFVGEKVFSYAKEAAEYYGVSPSTVFEWAKKGYGRNGVKCGYAHIEREETPIKIDKEQLSHTIIYDGIEFKTTKEAALYAGVKDGSTIIRWCRKGFSADGVPCRFKDDNTNYIYEKPNKAHTCKPVTIDGITYKSIKEACEALNISDYIVRKYYLNSKQANQQPSQGNFDNSTLEGSETNG